MTSDETPIDAPAQQGTSGAKDASPEESSGAMKASIPQGTSDAMDASPEESGGATRAGRRSEDKPRKEWWDDPRMPWQGKPRKQDIWCWTSLGLLGVYGIVLLPLRPILLGLNSYALAAVTGSNIAMVDIGARARVGPEPWWWVGLLMAAATSVKFDWIFWWCGKLWGHSIIEVWGGRSRWAARTGAWAESLARRWGGPAVFAAWFIPILPGAVIAAFVGDVGMKLRRYMLIDFAAGLCYRGLIMYLGYRIGAPAKHWVSVIAKYSNYIAIALTIFVVVMVIYRQRRDSRAAAAS